MTILCSGEQYHCAPAQEERPSDTRKWKRDRVQDKVKVDKNRITHIAECESLFKRVGNSEDEHGDEGLLS